MNTLASITRYKCPRCRKGDLFVRPFALKKPLQMNESCHDCQQKFEPEPGFYYGAMFISYIFTGFLFLGIGLPLALVFHLSAILSISVVLLVAVFFYFKILRLSRSIWIHIAVNYEPGKAKSV